MATGGARPSPSRPHTALYLWFSGRTSRRSGAAPDETVLEEAVHPCTPPEHKVLRKEDDCRTGGHRAAIDQETYLYWPRAVAADAAIPPWRRSATVAVRSPRLGGKDAPEVGFDKS
jgi:hypothetical protein